MAGRFDFIKYDKDAPGAATDEQTRRELRRIANLFLLSGITLVLFVLRALAEALTVSFIPHSVYVAWGIVMIVGWLVTLVYGGYVTFLAKRWGWFILCVIPITCVPVAVAYAWIRRQEIERLYLGDQPAPASRQRRGGRKKH